MRLERDYSPLAGVDGYVLPALSSKHLADGCGLVVRNADDRNPSGPLPSPFRLNAETIRRRGLQVLRVDDCETALFSHTPNNTASYVPATVYADSGLTTLGAAELFAKCNGVLRNKGEAAK